MVKTSHFNSVPSVLSLYQQPTKTACNKLKFVFSPLKCSYATLQTNSSLPVSKSGIEYNEAVLPCRERSLTLLKWCFCLTEALVPLRCGRAFHEVFFQFTCVLCLFVNPLDLLQALLIKGKKHNSHSTLERGLNALLWCRFPVGLIVGQITKCANKEW